MTDSKLSQAVVLTPADLAELRSDSEEGLSGLDSRLLELAAKGLSPDEIADEIGHGASPARVAVRIKGILAKRDWLSVIERKRLLHDKLVKLEEYLEDAMDKDKDPEPYEGPRGNMIVPSSDPRWAAQMLKVIQEMSRQIELDASEISNAEGILRKAHARLMIAALGVSFERLILDIRKTYPEVDEGLLRDSLELSLPLAIEMIEAQVSG